METSAPTARESALGFTEGVRCGWLTSDLIAWCEEHLVRTERLLLSHPGPLQRVCEHEVGVVTLQPSSPEARAKARRTTNSAVPRILEGSRHRVLQALRTAIDTDQVAFVHAALLASTVVRIKRADGLAAWRVRLTEDIALSDQVLALFALDALEHPSDYANELAVCDACGAVSLSPARLGSRHGCTRHPFGSCDTPRSRSGTPPHGLIVPGSIDESLT
ncbi:MAG: hypothetical protein HY898_22690 [Deltaproteobacteria bacterium]|nr:hypothetical protein [Deltaproteobacteria bacterium]